MTSSLFPGLSSPGKCHNKIPGLSRFSRTRTNPVWFLPPKHKIHISLPPCNILYFIIHWICTSALNVPHNRICWQLKLGKFEWYSPIFKTKHFTISNWGDLKKPLGLQERPPWHHNIKQDKGCQGVWHKLTQKLFWLIKTLTLCS